MILDFLNIFSNLLSSQYLILHLWMATLEHFHVHHFFSFHFMIYLESYINNNNNNKLSLFIP